MGVVVGVCCSCHVILALFDIAAGQLRHVCAGVSLVISSSCTLEDAKVDDSASVSALMIWRTQRVSALPLMFVKFYTMIDVLVVQ